MVPWSPEVFNSLRQILTLLNKVPGYWLKGETDLANKPRNMQIFLHSKFGINRTTGSKVMAKKLLGQNLNFLVITSGVGRDSRDGNFPGIPGFLGHFPEFPGKKGRESRDFPGNPGKIGNFRIPVSREFTNPGKLTPLVITFEPAVRFIPNFECRNICMFFGLFAKSVSPWSQ